MRARTLFPPLLLLAVGSAAGAAPEPGDTPCGDVRGSMVVRITRLRPSLRGLVVSGAGEMTVHAADGRVLLLDQPLAVRVEAGLMRGAFTAPFRIELRVDDGAGGGLRAEGDGVRTRYDARPGLDDARGELAITGAAGLFRGLTGSLAFDGTVDIERREIRLDPLGGRLCGDGWRRLASGELARPADGGLR